jgi:hypothetical protein
MDSATLQHLAPAPHVVTANHEGDTILFDTKTDRYYTLNAVGTRVWECLGQGIQVDAIPTRIAEEFDAPVVTIDADVRSLIAQLRQAALVTPSA